MSISQKINSISINKNETYNKSYYWNYVGRYNKFFWFFVRLYYRYVASYIMADAAKLEKGDKVLDIGCGVGILADQFDKLGYSVVGVDVSAEAIKNSISPKNCFLIKNTSQLNYPNKYFDLVVSREVLEHISIDEIDVCINEWDRVSNGEMIHIIAVTERGPSVNDDPTHVNVQSEKWWTEKFSKHGYKTIKNPKKLFFSALGNNGYLMFVKDI